LNIFLKFNLFQKFLFQHPLLQSPVSHDSSEIILICGFAAQGTFIIIINGKNSYCYFWSIEGIL